MSTQTIWQAYQSNGLPGARAVSGDEPAEQLYLAVLAFGANEFARAAEAAARGAILAPESLLLREAAAYLSRLQSQGRASVYVSGEAFGAFIRGGGNIPLYQAVSAALRAVYGEYDQFSLLDVGVGDGLALLPALTPNVTQLDLVEPSAAMLTRTGAALDERGVAYQAFTGGIQAFASQPQGHWQLAQATFSLQSLAPDERRAALVWLREHAERLLLVEFDPPAADEMYAPTRLEQFVARYEQGLAEYADDGGLVAQGFLMPVFFGYFDQSAARTNYEQPIAQWQHELQAVGFAAPRRQLLYNYWWAPAYLLDAG